jgi:3',5'-cyclic AMP phosphodiesterase CpdA
MHKFTWLFLLLVLAGFSPGKESGTEGLKIAIISDAHVQQIYGNFSDNDTEILTHPSNNRPVTIRTMQSQLTSTRLFNENYFAFLAALDDIAGRGVKYVILSGDFSDNGQPRSVNGVKEILDEYSLKHEIGFFLTTGNHDPSRPFISEGGQADYLGRGGRRQAVVSSEGLYRQTDGNALPVVVTEDMQNMGYREITSAMKDYGFFPKKDYFYWETPFSTYDQDDYSYEMAVEESSIENRMYTIEPNSMRIPDVSYLVEPVRGLWLLAIDANVYVPRNQVTAINDDADNYTSSGIGYNEVITHKRHIAEWVKTVSDRAESHGKTLIAFSHYPLVEYYNDASHLIRELFGDDKMQLNRLPAEEVARIFLEAGIKIHFSGHMHVNDTGIRRSEGKTLFNIQVPAPGGYIPAYKLITLRDRHEIEIETIVLDDVPRFNELFDLYRIEHDYLKESNDQNIWDIGILSSENYYEFTSWHLRELIRLRFFSADWPENFRDLLLNMNGSDLLTISRLDDSVFFGNLDNARSSANSGEWKAAAEKAEISARERNLNPDDFQSWNGSDLIQDFYRFKNADHLAFKDVPELRFRQYMLLNELYTDRSDTFGRDTGSSETPSDSRKIMILLQLVCSLADGAPSVHFMVNLQTGEIEDLQVSSREKVPAW